MNSIDDDALLASVLAGERDERDPAVQQLLAVQPKLRARLERMRLLVGQFDSLRDEQRAALANLSSERSAREGRAARPTTRRRIGALLLVAAAVVLVALGISWLQQRPEATPDTKLGPEHSPPISDSPSPVGEVTAIGDFRWPLALPREGSFTLRVYQPPYRSEDLLFEVSELQSSSFSPRPEHRAKFQPQMRWQVQAMRQEGTPGDRSPFYEVTWKR